MEPSGRHVEELNNWTLLCRLSDVRLSCVHRAGHGEDDFLLVCLSQPTLKLILLFDCVCGPPLNRMGRVVFACIPARSGVVVGPLGRAPGSQDECSAHLVCEAKKQMSHLKSALTAHDTKQTDRTVFRSVEGTGRRTDSHKPSFYCWPAGRVSLCSKSIEIWEIFVITQDRKITSRRNGNTHKFAINMTDTAAYLQSNVRRPARKVTQTTTTNKTWLLTPSMRVSSSWMR